MFLFTKGTNEQSVPSKIAVKAGSHDPIFASNYSLAHFFRQQLGVWMPIFDKFPAVFVYWMKIEHVSVFIQLDQKNRQSLIFPCSILLNIFTKWPPELGLAAVK